MIVTLSPLCQSVIFVCKAGENSNGISSFAYKYSTRKEVIESDEYTDLLRQWYNNGIKSFIILPAGVNFEMAKYYMYIDEISQNEFLVDEMSLDELQVD